MKIKAVLQLKSLGEIQIFNQGKQNEFKKRDCIFETIETKTPFKIEFTNEKINLLDELLIGSQCIMDLSIRNNYDPNDKTKVYHSYQVVKLKNLGI